MLCNGSRVLQKLICDKLFVIVETINDESPHDSDEIITQLLLFINLLYKERGGKGNELVVLYLDFKNAFDSLPYNFLLHKMNIWPLEETFEIIANYFSDGKEKLYL